MVKQIHNEMKNVESDAGESEIENTVDINEASDSGKASPNKQVDLKINEREVKSETESEVSDAGSKNREDPIDT